MTETIIENMKYPTAIDISQLPERVRGQVVAMRLACYRPVYVRRLPGKGLSLKVLPEVAVGTPAYGERERALFSEGWKMVAGDVD